MKKLIQIYIPVAGVGRDGASTADLKGLQDRLTQRFGGATAQLSSPLRGLWQEGGERVEEDRIAVFDVLVESFERQWWVELKSELEDRFHQKEILIRVLDVEIIE